MITDLPPERIEAQFKIQMLMSALIQSLVNKVTEVAEDEFEEILAEEELDIIVALSFIRVASEIAFHGGLEKDDFLGMSDEVFSAVSLNLSTPAGNA